MGLRLLRISGSLSWAAERPGAATRKKPERIAAAVLFMMHSGDDSCSSGKGFEKIRIKNPKVIQKFGFPPVRQDGVPYPLFSRRFSLSLNESLVNS